MSKYTTNQLINCLDKALDLFECKMNFRIRDKLVVAFFNGKNGKTIYRDFCTQHFPNRYEENHTLRETAAEAFYENGKYGILIRETIDLSLSDIEYIMLHEISHLFCVTYEYAGKDFYGIHCKHQVDNGDTCAGYAIWREAIADIMATRLFTDCDLMPLSSRKQVISELLEEITPITESRKMHEKAGIRLV